ncbi:MAG: hypothetical protein JXO72_03315 [Vicinamibacteria bacterium]|nr:hypothetical protein [Vicinamibacteria bacterium]
MTRAFVMAVTVLAMTGAAWAGKSWGPQTTVNLTSREAGGVYLFSRDSGDNVQFIGCIVTARKGKPSLLVCSARDAQGVTLKCASQNPLLLKVAGGISAYSLVSFRCRADDSIESVWVVNGSGQQ